MACVHRFFAFLLANTAAFAANAACEVDGAYPVVDFDVMKPPPVETFHISPSLDLELHFSDQGWEVVPLDARNRMPLPSGQSHGPTAWQMSAWMIQDASPPNLRVLPLHKYGGELVLDLREIRTSGEYERTTYLGGVGHICWRTTAKRPQRELRHRGFQ